MAVLSGTIFCWHFCDESESAIDGEEQVPVRPMTATIQSMSGLHCG